jgi:hypothetical protein
MEERRVAWLAGFTDGEGTITICKIRGYYRPIFQIVNTNYASLQECQAILESIAGRCPTIKSKSFSGTKLAHWKDSYQIQITKQQDVKKICQALIPHLITKKLQAELLVKFVEIRETVVRKPRYGSRGGQYRPHGNREEALWLACKQLNRDSSNEPVSVETIRQTLLSDDIVRPTAIDKTVELSGNRIATHLACNILDDQYSIINKRPQQLALVARRSREKHGASVFNNAFNTSIFAGGDTLALCASAHTAIGTATTQANRGTTSLSATAIEAARLAMQAFKDETDNLVDVVPDTLLIPVNLEETAWQINKSERVLGSNFNDPNFQRGKYKVVVWPRLSDSNNWFLIDSRYMKMFLKWFDRIPVEFNKDKDFDTLTNVGSSTGNCGKQMDETAGNTLELQMLIAEAEAIANSDNSEDWSISSQALVQVG